MHTFGGQVGLRTNYVEDQHQFKFKSEHKAFSELSDKSL